MRILLVGFILFVFCAPLQAGGRVPKVPSSQALLLRAQRKALRKLAQANRIPSVKLPARLPQVRFLTPTAPRIALDRPKALASVRPSLALPLDADGYAMGSGFVIRSGSGRLYMVTSYHVTGSSGKPVGVRLFLSDGRSVDYTGLTVAAGGSYGINSPDVSLVELPAEAERWVRPLGVAAQAPKAGSRLFMWGRPYDAPGIELARGLRVASAYGMKIVLSRTERIKYLGGMCGAPVLDENGLVTGIYGGRGGQNDALFAIDARKSIGWLLENYESGRFTPYTFKVFGHTALELGEGESVRRVRHITAAGQVAVEVNLSVYSGRFDAQQLETFLPDLKSNDRIEFEILKNRMPVRREIFYVP